VLAPVTWDSNTSVADGTIPVMLTQYAGVIDSASYLTNGPTGAAFTFAVNIDGTPVTSLSAVTVNSSSFTTQPASGANTFSGGSVITLGITGSTGPATEAIVQINLHRT